MLCGLGRRNKQSTAEKHATTAEDNPARVSSSQPVLVGGMFPSITRRSKPAAPKTVNPPQDPFANTSLQEVDPDAVHPADRVSHMKVELTSFSGDHPDLRAYVLSGVHPHQRRTKVGTSGAAGSKPAGASTSGADCGAWAEPHGAITAVVDANPDAADSRRSMWRQGHVQGLFMHQPHRVLTPIAEEEEEAEEAEEEPGPWVPRKPHTDSAKSSEMRPASLAACDGRLKSGAAYQRPGRRLIAASAPPLGSAVPVRPRCGRQLQGGTRRRPAGLLTDSVDADENPTL